MVEILKNENFFDFNHFSDYKLILDVFFLETNEEKQKEAMKLVFDKKNEEFIKKLLSEIFEKHFNSSPNNLKNPFLELLTYHFNVRSQKTAYKNKSTTYKSIQRIFDVCPEEIQNYYKEQKLYKKE